jgi:hypothetical protein
MKALDGRDSIAPIHSWPRHQTGLSSQRHAPAVLTPGTHWIGGGVGPKAGLDTETRKKSFASVGDRTPGVQSVVKTLHWLSYPASIVIIVAGLSRISCGNVWIEFV